MDSEPAETEGEAAEDGDPGDTGAELDGMGPSLPSPPRDLLHLGDRTRAGGTDKRYFTEQV